MHLSKHVSTTTPQRPHEHGPRVRGLRTLARRSRSTGPGEPRLGLLWIALGLACSLLVSTAAAETPADDVDLRARELMRQGEAAFVEKRYAAAEAAYEQALSLKPGYDVAGNLAEAERLQGKHREAAAHYAMALRTVPASVAPELKQQLREGLTEAQAEIGTVDLRVSHAGATVRVDGDDVGQSPLRDPVFVPPGRHVFVAQLPGLRPAQQQLRIEAGSHHQLQLTLTDPAEGSGGSGGAGGADGAAGAGGGDESPSLAPPLVIGAAGIVALGVGIGMLVAADGSATSAAESLADLRNQTSDPNPCGPSSPHAASSACTSILDDQEAHDTYQGVGVAGLVIGGAALAASAVWLVVALTADDEGTAGGEQTAAREPRPSTLTIVPWIQPGPRGHAGGLAVQGHL